MDQHSQGSQALFSKAIEEGPQRLFSDHQSCHSHYRPKCKGLTGRAVRRKGCQHLWTPCKLPGTTSNGGSSLCTLVPCSTDVALLGPAVIWLLQLPLQRAPTHSPLECRAHRPQGHGCLYLDFKGRAALTGMAQLVEHQPTKRKVAGSVPVRARAWVAGLVPVGACVRGN